MEDMRKDIVSEGMRDKEAYTAVLSQELVDYILEKEGEMPIFSVEQFYDAGLLDSTTVLKFLFEAGKIEAMIIGESALVLFAREPVAVAEYIKKAIEEKRMIAVADGYIAEYAILSEPLTSEAGERQER